MRHPACIKCMLDKKGLNAFAGRVQALIASASEDNTARIWSADGMCLQTISHPGKILRLLADPLCMAPGWHDCRVTKQLTSSWQAIRATQASNLPSKVRQPSKQRCKLPNESKSRIKSGIALTIACMLQHACGPSHFCPTWISPLAVLMPLHASGLLTLLVRRLRLIVKAIGLPFPPPVSSRQIVSLLPFAARPFSQSSCLGRQSACLCAHWPNSFCIAETAGCAKSLIHPQLSASLDSPHW